MGTWGIAIKDSDTFADIYIEFFVHIKCVVRK